MARGYPDYEGDKSGLYPMPGWAAFEAEDVSWSATLNNVATDNGITTNYVVPEGRTLYIVQATFRCYGSNAADRDNNQIGELFLRKTAPPPSIFHAHLGGNGGGQVSFPLPLVYTAGQTFTILLFNRSNHNCNLGYAIGGYLI